MIKKILPSMIKVNKGHIVNIASVVAFAPGIGVSDYCASKTALYNFHSSLNLGIKIKPFK